MRHRSRLSSVRSVPRLTVVGLVVASLAGCAGPALRAAERGDTAALRTAIAGKHVKGKLGNGEAASLARAVAEREITTARDEGAALARLRETRACASDLDDALEERMKTRDGAGAEAALERLEGGSLSEGAARAWVDDPDDRWRAVGARTLHRDGDRGRRHAALVDPSPRVRRSAIRAAATAEDPTDLDLLAETARVDPEPMLRNEALRGMSAIVRDLGKQGRGRAAELALRLRDLWTSGDDAIKEDVAVAWGLAPVFENGGREALRFVLGSAHGPGAIAAAGVVLRNARDDADLAASATGLLARTIADGSRPDRLHALAIAPLEGPLLDAIRRAARDDDADVRVTALASLLRSRPDREAAMKDLYALASAGVKGGAPTEDARVLERAQKARHALATAGELRVQGWIEEDLASADAQRKLAAASALSALGRPARAAPLLTDADASVRTRAACTILAGARR